MSIGEVYDVTPSPSMDRYAHGEGPKILTLAAGGIGLLVVLLTTVGPSSSWELALYILAGLSFIAAVCCAIWIFSRNSEHLEDVINTGRTGHDVLLIKLDAWMLAAFLIGVVLTGVVAVSAGYSRLRKENSMSEQQGGTQTKIVTPDQSRSLSGIGNLGQTSGGNGTQRGDAGQQGGNTGSGQSDKK
jgi:hypothetical protein